MNKVKEKLKNGQASIGGWIQIGHPAVAEIMSQAGFDWLAIDNEHGIIDLGNGMNIFNGMRGTDVLPMVRVHENNEIIIRQWCDAGARGIIVPMVNTPEQAHAAVAAAKYPPLGKRGFGYCRANNYGRFFDDHAKCHNEDVLVTVQIEHIEAIRNIDSILAVEGVDAAFIGPYDLSGSMGLTGQIYHPDVIAACNQMLAACKKHGKAAGIHVVPVDPDRIQKFVSEGFTFIAAGIDTVFLRYASETILKCSR
jgi:2-keto-3-deoxy-L-rhamnonate aldolase RhmA